MYSPYDLGKIKKTIVKSPIGQRLVTDTVHLVPENDEADPVNYTEYNKAQTVFCAQKTYKTRYRKGGVVIYKKGSNETDRLPTLPSYFLTGVNGWRDNYTCIDANSRLPIEKDSPPFYGMKATW